MVKCNARMLNVKRVSAIFSMLVTLAGGAQDLHFSHFYNSPLSLNPALTGVFGGCYRLGVNYRTQWRSITVPYRTFSAYVDGGAMHVGPFNKVSLGGVLLFDDAGDGHLKTTRAMLSAAVQKSFGSLGLSLGANIGYTQKKLDFTRLIFDDQWNGTLFDPSITTQEPGNTDPIAEYDAQAGFVASWTTEDDNTFFLGFSAVHILRPYESFYFSDNQVGFRPVIHGGAFLQINPQLIAEPAFAYMRQKRASELMLGCNVSRLNMGPLDYVLAGLWWRGSGDAVPVIGGSWNQVHLLISYDVNFSSLVPATNLRGGLELSMKFIVACGDKLQGPVVVPCIRL